MYYLVWEYEVEEAQQAKFEGEYGRSGAWFKLFEPCGDFLGHELIKSTSGTSYILIDKWMDQNSHERFVKSVQLEYDHLNNTSKALYSSEKLIGRYVTL